MEYTKRILQDNPNESPRPARSQDDALAKLTAINHIVFVVVVLIESSPLRECVVTAVFAVCQHTHTHT